MKCYGMVYEGELTDQHAYISSSIGVAESPVMIVDAGDTPEGWELLQTATILVVDNEVTIGFSSTSNGGTSGWWCATNFALFYHGEEGKSDIEKTYESKIEECQEFCSTMHLASDKESFSKVIADNTGKTEKEEMVAALEILKEALEQAQLSESTYTKFVNGEYATITENLKKGTYDNYVARILTSQLAIVDNTIQAPDAAYTNISDLDDLLKTITNNYCPSMATAVEYYNSISNTEAKDSLVDVIEKQTASVESYSNLMPVELIVLY